MLRSLVCATTCSFLLLLLSKNRCTNGFTTLRPTRAPCSYTTASSNVQREAVRVTSSETELDKATSPKTTTIGKIVFLLPKDASSVPSKFGSSSPVQNPSVLEAAQHVVKKSYYFADGMLDYDILVVSSDDESSSEKQFQDLCRAEIVIALGLKSDAELEYAGRVFQERRNCDIDVRKRLCHFTVDCSRDLPALVGPFDETNPSLVGMLLPWTEDATARRMHTQILDLFTRWTSDDFCYAMMLFLNQFSGSEIDWVKHRTDASWEKGPIKNAQEFYDMINECGDCIGPCVQDEKCRECLGKLTELDPRDQATSYRTLVSYESDLLTNFSLCIFTRKNIFNCDAKIPTIPKVEPITTWKGKELTEEIGRKLLVGHLDDAFSPEGALRLDISWKVACGANVAYDQFPSQNQLFYPAARGRDMWYDPVFRVETLDGRNVWCKRHYKVRPGPIPGTFRFSVLDNGVTSDEFWSIIGAADDLSWIAFHYAGAAKAVGQQYLGGLLCTPDGSLPAESMLPEIWDCFRSAGIQPFELYVVDNRQDTPGAVDAGPPPLDFYRNEVIVKRAQEAEKK